MKWKKYTIETTTAAEDFMSSMLMDPVSYTHLDVYKRQGENTRLVTTQNGKKMAKIMFFNGLSRTCLLYTSRRNNKL